MTLLPDDREKRLAQLKHEVTRRGFDRHASIVRNIQELPPEFQTASVMKALTDLTMDTAILFPQQLHRGWDYIPKQALLFTPTGVVHLLASIWPDQEPGITFLEGRDIMYVNVKLLLLYGYLEIVARGQVSPVRLGLEFNTVAWWVISRPLRRMLITNRAKLDTSNVEADRSPAGRRAFAELPLKFSNGVKIHGLLPGEQLEELIFQPGVRRQWLHFFQRPVTANTLLMLTSNYVVAIREEPNVEQGWILTYIPRGCINEMRRQPGDLSDELVIELEWQDQRAEYKILLNHRYVEAWRSQWIRHGGAWRELSPVNCEESRVVGKDQQ